MKTNTIRLRFLYGLFLFWAAAGNSSDFCSNYQRKLVIRVPQLFAIEGDRSRLTFTLKSWKRGGADGTKAEEGAQLLAKQIGKQVGAYGANHLKSEHTASDLASFNAGIELLVFEMLNNASFHGNKGDANKQVKVEVSARGETVSIEIVDQSGFFYDVTTGQKVQTVAEIDKGYKNPEQGGGLGNFLVEAYKERFRVRITSSPEKNTAGEITGTRVQLQLEPRESLKPG